MVASDAIAGMIGQPILVNANQQAAPDEVYSSRKLNMSKDGHCRSPEGSPGRDGIGSPTLDNYAHEAICHWISEKDG
jgi:hypothetical protein